MLAYHEDTHIFSILRAGKQLYSCGTLPTQAPRPQAAYILSLLADCGVALIDYQSKRNTINWEPLENQFQTPAFGAPALATFYVAHAHCIATDWIDDLLCKEHRCSQKHRPACSPYFDVTFPSHLHTFPSRKDIWRRWPQVSGTPRQSRPDEILRAVSP